MISQEHFEAAKAVRQAAQGLSLACAVVSGTSALMHMAFDREASPRLSATEDALVRKLRSVK